MFWLRDILTKVKDNKRLVMMGSGDLRAIRKSILCQMPVMLNLITVIHNTEISVTFDKVFNTNGIVLKFPVRTRSLVSSNEERKKEVFLGLLHNASFFNEERKKQAFDELLCNASFLDEERRNVVFDELLCNFSFSYDSLVHDFPGPLQEEFASPIMQDEAEKLVQELLYKKKYFIILKDVGGIDTFNDIQRVLPSGRHGCTILLTTPSPELVLQCRYGSQTIVDSKVPRDHPPSMPQTCKPTIDEGIVGFEEEIQRTIEMLTGGPEKLLIISIVGMPGQGKTTLARTLYNDFSVVQYFDIQAWCYVSQTYKKRELLSELLGQVDPHSNTSHYFDEELLELLYKNLKEQRFLIVFDDIWSISDWHDLWRCFPNDKNGSRIIFTTRLRDLASKAQFGSTQLPLRPLSNTESWALLEKKLPQRESYPPELLVIGNQIAKNCKGLPLLVILTAGLLVKMEKNEDQWKQIAESLSSCILDKEAHAKAIIELSYKHFPEYLKPCFLYFGVFIKDREVLVKKLIRLWIAEGFIKPIESKSLEDVANDYLMDLIGRSLLTIAQGKSSGGVKSCRMHDLLRDFCMNKATEENFLQLTREDDELFPFSHDLNPNYSHSSSPITYHLRRLCIYSQTNHFAMLKCSVPFVRSILLFASGDMWPVQPHDVSFISHNFKLLWILDLEDINIGDSFEAIVMLIHLKYLAIQGHMDFIPSSIANIWKLETLLVKAKAVRVPDSICDMTRLRHVHINKVASFIMEPHRFQKSSALENLQTLSTPCLAFGDDTEKMLRKLPGIRKLKCIFLDSCDNNRQSNQFPALEVLCQLVSLNVFYNGKGMYPCKFDFPPNLRKLTLSNFRLPWDQISQLATLCNLEVLKLLNNAFEGETWEMQGEVVFKNLKFLKFDTLDIVKWSAPGDRFPCLRSLIVHKCEQLDEVPLSFGGIATLEMIELMWCHTPNF